MSIPLFRAWGLFSRLMWGLFRLAPINNSERHVIVDMFSLSFPIKKIKIYMASTKVPS